MDRKQQLLERIRSRRLFAPSRKQRQREELSEKYKRNSYAKKKTRRIDLGWMNYNESDGDFKQVRAAKGGGTRHVSVERHTKIREIKTMAESLFLTGGKSKYLVLRSLHSDMRDICHRQTDEESATEELYKRNQGRTTETVPLHQEAERSSQFSK